ncbi:MAG TPA: pyridoxal-dependent decarboxylase [Rhodothermales bacterium]|nr:pyridoxal-dependent decarboxylase [Rhodothermales bacterium]
MSDPKLEPCFLGPYGENNDLFEKLLVEFMRDHIYWRRNFHPEDPPVISTLAAHQPHYEAFVGRMRRELHVLSAALKRSVPFFSPRYMGHMVSDLLIPGLLAEMITLPYNPNNVVDEAAPVTLDLELEVGLQLAQMLGYAYDERDPDCAFGYLTSGGTVANYQALRTFLALKLYPMAVQAGCKNSKIDFAWKGRSILDHTDWELANLSIDEVLHLYDTLAQELDKLEDQHRSHRILKSIQQERAESLGLFEFHQRHPDCPPPVVLVPVTAHYSWQKSMKLMGLGTSHLHVVSENRMRMDSRVLDDLLAEYLEQRQPVLAVVGVLGTTEFGTLDPIHRIVAARDKWHRRGLAFSVHVDAAWGGYLASIFRHPDGTLRPWESVSADFHYFPSREVYDSIAGLAETDSATIDPHKLGYIPYGAGAYICRNQRMMDLLAQDAVYVFDMREEASGFKPKFRSLGKYIMEGSKSGASAAAVWVTHRTMPLDHEHFGLLPATTIRATEQFWNAIHLLTDRVADIAHVIVPFEPDSNLICLTFNPVDNRSLARMNAFVSRVYKHLRVDRDGPLQIKQFFGSTTRLFPDALGPGDTERILGQLNIAPDSLMEDPDDTAYAADSILILRHTLMNPWLTDERNGINYVELYCAYLEQLIREEARHF